MMYAGNSTNVKKITLLLGAGARINARDKNGRTALHHAIRGSFSAVAVKYFLEKGADPDIGDVVGYTPLMQAALAGKCEMVRALLESGADPKLKTNKGLDALHFINLHMKFYGKTKKVIDAKKMLLSFIKKRAGK